MKNELICCGRKFRADVRTVSDMGSVAMDKKWLAGADGNTPVYYMFRDVWKKPSDREILRKSGVRYDITVIPPCRMGREFVKTYGHGHPRPAGSRHTYPELYEVLEGDAHYLLQGIGKSPGDIIVVYAKKGDVVLVPPDYEHVTINPSRSMLKMANLVAEFVSDYSRIRRMGGAAYFETTGREWVRNPSYGDVPALEFVKPLGNFRSNIYALLKNPEKLSFLSNPDEALGISSNLWKVISK